MGSPHFRPLNGQYATLSEGSRCRHDGSLPTRSARSAWMPSRRRIPVTRACRWAWRTSPRCCGPTTCGTTRATRSGRTATASSSRTATARCCSTRCCYLTGYPMPLEALRNFRQLGYPTAGHPEVEQHLGIETTTGPLGQGLANAVGMAHRRAQSRRGVQPAGVRGRRSPHLGLPGRRVPDGRHFARSLFARRHAGPRPADRLLRRQRHLDRRRGARVVHRRHAAAFRGLRLARDPGRGRPRFRGSAPRDRCGACGNDAALPDLLQDHHRLGRAQQAGHRGHPRLGARRGGSRGCPPRARLAAPAVRGARGHPPWLGRARARPRVRGRRGRRF